MTHKNEYQACTQAWRALIEAEERTMDFAMAGRYVPQPIRDAASRAIDVFEAFPEEVKSAVVAAS
jgi:hypothetical protein